MDSLTVYSLFLFMAFVYGGLMIFRPMSGYSWEGEHINLISFSVVVSIFAVIFITYFLVVI